MESIMKIVKRDGRTVNFDVEKNRRAALFSRLTMHVERIQETGSVDLDRHSGSWDMLPIIGRQTRCDARCRVCLFAGVVLHHASA